MEYVFRRPAFMTTCVYAVYGVFIVSVLPILSCCIPSLPRFPVQSRVGCPLGAWHLESVSIHNSMVTETLISF